MHRLLMVAILLPSAGSVRGLAQEGAGSRHRIAVGLGVGGAEERDGSVSPIRYGGAAWGATIEYGFEPVGARTALRVSVIRARLHRLGSIEGRSAGEQARIALEGSHLRRLGDSHGGSGVFAGVLVDATVSERRQRFSGNASEKYFVAVLSVAPAARIDVRSGEWRAFAYQVSVPLVTGIVQSYANIHLLQDSNERRPDWTSLTGARALRQVVTFTRGSGRWGFRAGAQVDVFAYAPEPGLSGVRGFASASVVRAFR